MEGFIGTLRCACGRNLKVDGYELMFIQPNHHSAGYTANHGITKVECMCGRQYEVQIGIQVNSVYTPAEIEVLLYCKDGEEVWGRQTTLEVIRRLSWGEIVKLADWDDIDAVQECADRVGFEIDRWEDTQEVLARN